MGLTVNRQTVKKVTVNRTKMENFNRQLSIKPGKISRQRTIIASYNGLKWTISLYFPK